MRTNYQINSGVHFNVFSQDQLEELFSGEDKVSTVQSRQVPTYEF